MPTGYTYLLQERNYDVKKWLKEDVIRAMGLCSSLREEGNLSEGQIIALLDNFVPCQRATSYKSDLKEAEKELGLLLKKTDAQWKRKFNLDLSAERKRYQESLDKYTLEKGNMKKAREECFNLLSSQVNKQNEDSVFIGTLKFALSQIDLVLNSEYSTPPYRSAILDFDFWGEYKDYEINLCESRVASYKKRILANSQQPKPKKINYSKEYIKFTKLVDKVK